MIKDGGSVRRAVRNPGFPMTMLDPRHAAPAVMPVRVTARALALGARLDAHGLERPDTISTTPLAFHMGTSGFVVLYRFGVAVLVGLSPVEEDTFIQQIKARVSGERDRIDDETAILEISADGEDRVLPGGPIGEGSLTAAVAGRCRWTGEECLVGP